MPTNYPDLFVVLTPYLVLGQPLPYLTARVQFKWLTLLPRKVLAKSTHSNQPIHSPSEEQTSDLVLTNGRWPWDVC